MILKLYVFKCEQNEEITEQNESTILSTNSPNLIVKYSQIFTDIYPTEIGTYFGRNETLTCNKTLFYK